MSDSGVQCPYCDGKKYVYGRDHDDSHVKYACGPCNATGTFLPPSEEIDGLNRTRRSLRLERDKLLAEIKLLRGQLTRANKRIEEQADILRRLARPGPKNMEGDMTLDESLQARE